jgi:hypothetical protein
MEKRERAWLLEQTLTHKRSEMERRDKRYKRNSGVNDVLCRLSLLAQYDDIDRLPFFFLYSPYHGTFLFTLDHGLAIVRCGVLSCRGPLYDHEAAETVPSL